jgi:hypothetical protein
MNRVADDPQSGNTSSNRQPDSGKGTPRKRRTRIKPQDLAEPSANGQEDDEKRETFEAVPSTELPDKPHEFVFDPFVPFGVITMVVGPILVGKSTYLASLLGDAVGADRINGGKKRSPGTALVLPGEEGASRQLKQRLEKAAGPAASRIHVIMPAQDGTGERLRLPSQKDYLGRLVRKYKPRILTADPIDSHWDVGLNENSNQDMRSVLELLQNLAVSEKLAVVITHHPGKAAGNNVLGSVALQNVPRSINILRTDPSQKGRYILEHLKHSETEQGPARFYELVGEGREPRLFHLLGAVDAATEALLEAGLSPSDQDAVEDAVTLIRKVLRDGPQPTNEVTKMALKERISDRAFRAAKKIVQAKPKRKGWGPGSICYLLLPGQKLPG